MANVSVRTTAYAVSMALSLVTTPSVAEIGHGGSATEQFHATSSVEVQALTDSEMQQIEGKIEPITMFIAGGVVLATGAVIWYATSKWKSYKKDACKSKKSFMQGTRAALGC